jgi:hypothetical protein
MMRGRLFLGLIVGAMAACGDATVGGNRALTSGPTPGAPEVPPEPRCATDYDQMCGHYCDTLAQTVLYVCLNRGDADCLARVQGDADRCRELRCVPRLVQPSLCERQCEALANQYRSFCANADASKEALCPSSPEVHDDACRSVCPCRNAAEEPR